MTGLSLKPSIDEIVRERKANGVPTMTLQRLLGIELPIIQAPMAGVQGSAVAVAVSNAGGLGSLPCAMLSLDAIRNELAAIKAQTGKPFNVNFFCHAPPAPSSEREATWRGMLSPYYKEYGIDADTISVGPGRAPFSSEAADVLDEFKPPVVSFYFGLPSPELLARVRALGAKISVWQRPSRHSTFNRK
jgi:nitronate monooxygenase